MTAATSLVWELAGRPAPTGPKGRLVTDTPGVCCVTGEYLERTAPADKALGDNFTDRSMFRAPYSDRVGEATVWCCSGRGKASLRMYSIIAAPGVDIPTNPDAWLQGTPGLALVKMGPERWHVADVLANPPEGEWLVSVATSGQKHVIPYATVNHGRSTWRVRMENTDVTSNPDEWRHVHATALALRRLGVSAENVLHGLPGLIKDPDILTEWRGLSLQLAPYVGSPLLELALWTITKGLLE